jgi:UDP-N-acetylmuramoyl-L-alanyl-D-glutamate--2,6-diaminopimelate ligase
MGEIAGRYSDYCIVTSDNPRTENPMSIIEDILPGLQKTACPYVVVENRREAIAHALKACRSEDVLILAGKGHETYQLIQGKSYPFDEKQIVAELLRKAPAR